MCREYPPSVTPTMSSPAMSCRITHQNRDRLVSTLSRTALLFGAPLFAEAARAQTPSFTLEAALSAPFPSELTAAPAGAKVAWIFDAQGSRNIWVGEPGTNGSFTSRQLTRFTGDIGVEIGTLAW